MRDSTYKTTMLVAALVASQSLAFVPTAALATPVRIAGQQAFNVVSGAATRTATIQKNIDNALVATPNRSPESVNIVYVKGQPVITLGGFYVTTVDTATAKASSTTPALLAQKWADGLRRSLKNKSSVDSYVAQLTGSTATATAGTTTTTAGSFPYYQQGRVVYIPAGMMIPVTLKTSISTQTARTGDKVEGEIAQAVNLGETSIPQGSVIEGEVTNATAGQRYAKSGTLALKFDSIKTPDGQVVPITAHIVGGIGQYQGQANGAPNTVRGESGDQKLKDALERGAIGAAGGALAGTAIGAIASHGWHTGRGAVAGTVIGGALGVADSLLLRKGHDVTVSSGSTLNLQLDAPASLAATSGQM